MTHNIVAEFSCSVWKSDEIDRIPVDKTVGDLKTYKVVSGSIFNEEYNETLDSAVLVLSQVVKEDRLSNIKPYDFVRVYDKSSRYDENTGRYSFDKIYLVDNFNEKENNINEHIFSYTINVMSETKLLEKIQCPNLMVSHKVENGVISKKTIYQKIKEYMELYVPKVKFFSNGEWSYQPLIKMPPETVETYSIYVTFNSSQFVQVGSQQYMLAISSNPLPDDIDITEVTIGRYEESYSSSIHVIEGPQIRLNEDNRTFLVYLKSTAPGHGTITIYYDYHEGGDLYKRFKVPCADLPFNAPTLRQLLTTLMQQVGCIPVVRNRTLGYLDFQAVEQQFGGDKGYSIDNTVNFITRGLSSDSFVNTLVNMSDQVLDSGNEVICETLGFRDSNNVLIKQKQNLQLETSFPIYKVNKCILRASGEYMCMDTLNDQGKIVVSSSYHCMVFGANPSPTTDFVFFYYREVTLENGVATIIFNASTADKDFTIRIKDGLHYTKRNSDGSYSIVETVNFPNFDINSSNLVRRGTDWNGGSIQNITWAVTKTFNNAPSSATGFWFEGVCHSNSTGDNREFCFILFDKDDPRLKYGPISGTNVGLSANAQNAATAGLLINDFGGFRVWDISKLIVESSARNLLSRNFEEMTSLSGDNLTIENVSKYVYATIGYNIGSKVISGFSEVWNQGTSSAVGWIDYEKTYIENIANVLMLTHSEIVSEDASGILQKYLANIPIVFSDSTSTEFPVILSYGTIIDAVFAFYNPNSSGWIHFGSPFFSNWFVDLYYQPLNSFNLSYVKSQEPVDFALEQYDGNASGLTDFDRLSIHEQEQVDRIGNEVLTILQRTEKYEDIQTFENGPLYFMDDTNRSGSIDDQDKGIKYIIFKRSFTVNNNCFNVTYVGSKDAVLKDYFTSIRTKYRAYNYVDYSQSTLRKEKDVFFVRISSDFYDGDDRIWLGAYSVRRRSNLRYWIYDLSNESTQKDAISYECEYNLAKVEDSTQPSGYSEEVQTVKNSVSAIATRNSLGFIYEYTDNVGAGTYLRDILEQVTLGGVVQKWQIWADDYNDDHIVSFVNNIDFYPDYMITETEFRDIAIQIGRSPIVGQQFLDIFSSSNVIFGVVDDNSPSPILPTLPTKMQRTFYKDEAERINHTVQFIYYAPNNDVLFGEDFIAGSPLISRFENKFNAVYGSNKFSINTEKHSKPEGDTLINIGNPGGSFYIRHVEPFSSSQAIGLRVYWGNYNVIKMCNYSSSGIVDIAVFKKTKDEEYTDFYFMINDTKSDYVLTDKNGVLYRAYKVKTYKDGDDDEGRKVISLFNNNEGE